jgi:hypothetical protein
MARIRCCERPNLTKLGDQSLMWAHSTSGGNVLLKTFLFGILLGIAAAATALMTIPAVDQQREISLVTVNRNGGNLEIFHINIPVDRVMNGTPGENSTLPPGLSWPNDDILAGVTSEIFKIRNARNTIVGVAARTVAREEDSENIDWVIHLPARGSLFINMEPQAADGGHRIGALRAGSQEFDDLSGFVTERWVADTSGEEDAPVGRIELLATYVGIADPVDVDDVESLE